MNSTDARALIVWGGWDGHQPKAFADLFQRLLEQQGFSVLVAGNLEPLADAQALAALDLIVPICTMGNITDAQLNGVCSAVRGGVGLAGCHGGMCDAFRSAPEWQFMTGGQWVAHPGDCGVTYTVHFTGADHPITRGLSDFQIQSEQYYMHIDPAIKVLATTRFPLADGPHVGNGPVDMPVAWTKVYGKGRVFYCSLGHAPADIDKTPTALELMRRGFSWAANRLF
jgi:type 1 glutamine amidotransferase